MTSLYDLLGAHEDDDADALKKAFRKAVKEHHPDLHPGDPDAPERFRQFIAANALLRDMRQRATYDRVLQASSSQLECLASPPSGLGPEGHYLAASSEKCMGEARALAAFDRERPMDNRDPPTQITCL